MSEQNKIDEIKARYQDDCKWAADPEDVRYLLQEIERKNEALRWYADVDTRTYDDYCEDLGDRAREAL